MFEIIFDLPIDPQLYVLFVSVLLPISLHIALQYINGAHNPYSFIKTSSVYEKYITKGLRYSTHLSFHTIIICITKCIKRKDSPDADNDDHHLLLTP